MTPRQMAGLLFVAEKRKDREHAGLLALHAMAARGEPKKLRKQIKDLVLE